MGRIKDTGLYNFDKFLSLDDYLIGTDADTLEGKTKNYKLANVFATFKAALELTSLEFTFADGSDPDIDHTDPSYFTANNTLAGAVTTLRINKQSLTGADISSLVDIVSQNVSSFVLRLYKPSAAGELFFFSISGIVDSGSYYTINVTNFVGGNSLSNETTYGLVFDLAGVPSIYNETDPIFTASPASSILLTQISNWDAAHSWGNHALAGYITGETDPVFSASAAGGITAGNIANWNSAHSWGNHSLAGYVTTETDPTVPSHVKSILTSDLTSWDLAYSWGNHAVAGYLTSESDPVFAASPAGDITSIQINQWTQAYSWGNHAIYGYLREIQIDTLAELNNIVTDATLVDTTYTGFDARYYTETETNSFFSGGTAITGYNKSDWDTAFGWGNHAGLYVDLVNNQYTIGGEKTFTGAVQLFNGRVGVQTPVFGGSRLGDSGFQTPAIDVNSINIKDGVTQKTALAIFTSAVGGSDGYVTTYKNFVDSVNVMSINGLGQETYDGVGREVEATIGLRNDFTGGQFRVFDFFNNDYDAATDVAVAQGWVAIHGGGATAKKIGLWRYDTTTYTNIWELSSTNTYNFGIPNVQVQGNQIWHSGNFTDNSANWNTAFGWGNHAVAGYAQASSLANYQLLSQKGAANGYAPLNASSQIDPQYLPSFVDDVLEYANLAAFPVTGETGKLYIALDSNFTYRWGGSSYVQVGGGGAGAVDSVFGRVGAITAQVGDYSSFYLGLTATATNSNLLLGKTFSSSGNRFDVIPFVGGDGVMEVGNFIDFHGTDGGTTDFLTRLEADAANSLRLTGNFTATGTISGAGGTMSGVFTMGESVDLKFSTASRIGAGGGDTYFGLLTGNLFIDDVGVANRFLFERTTGNFTATGQGNFNKLFSTNDITRGFNNANTSGLILKTISANPILEFQRWTGVGADFRGTRVIKELQDLVIQHATQAVTGSQVFNERFRFSEGGNFNATGTGSFAGINSTGQIDAYTNPPLPNSLSYAQAQIEIRSDVNFRPMLGFHRQGAEAAALYFENDTWKNINASGVIGTFWTDRNDGAGSGLDADLLDGVQLASIGGFGQTWGYVPRVLTNGVMEIGRYIDFHSTSNSGVDNTFRLDNTSAGNLTCSGTLTATNFILSSDARLKERIEPLNNVEGSLFYSYYRKDEPSKLRFGTIAQEVEKVYPDLVIENEEGEKSVMMTDLLSKKVAEQEQQLKDQEERIQLLEDKLELILKSL